MRDFHTVANYLARMTFEEPAKWIAAAAFTALQFVLPESGMRELAGVTLLFVVLDTATGIAASIISGNRITSARMSRFFVKILGYASVLFVCSMAARYALPTGGENSFDVRTVLVNVLLWVILLTEGISILENVQRMGIKLPPFLSNILKDRLQALSEEHDPKKPRPEERPWMAPERNPGDNVMDFSGVPHIPGSGHLPHKPGAQTIEDDGA